MALFHMKYFVWLFTFYTLIKFSHSGQPEDDFVEWAKTMDRGGYSAPISSLSNMRSTLDGYRKQFYKEFYCNYVITATVHLHLTKQFLVNVNYRKLLKATEIEYLTFTNEVNQILTVLLNDGHEDSRHPITDVMWILLVYCELEQTFFSPTSFESLSQATKNHILKTHDVAVQLLGDFIKTQTCEMFDPLSKDKVSDVVSLVKRKKVSAKVLDERDNIISLLERVQQNRQMFNKQSEHNCRKDYRFNHRPDIKHNFLDNLLMKRLLEYNNDNITDFEKFGIQLDLNPVADQLGVYYELGKNLNKPLYVRINNLIKFEQTFVRSMKVVAIRLILRYFSNIMEWDDETIRRFVFGRNMKPCNDKMIGYLEKFAARFEITNDEYLRQAIQKLKGGYLDRTVVNGYVYYLLISLTHIGCNVATSINVDVDVSDLEEDKPIETEDMIIETWLFESRPFGPVSSGRVWVTSSNCSIEDVHKTSTGPGKDLMELISPGSDAMAVPEGPAKN
ncbi:uncharacterized protein LOC126842157 [Adelges cooleyi]|uniref:uncharacterized protein LOC126842157 n=1 Tax=Adelges cooleyi TaxID=133065 RepID=UPI00217F645F|nr:uncharacterized protein LOC126842157 [Adelges cooleyi]